MWRFNSSLLSEPNFILFYLEFSIFYAINNTPDVSPSTVWETNKAYARSLIISHMKSKRRKALDHQRELEMQLSKAIKAYVETNLETMLAVKASFNSLLT